jgi:hypothetical protein
VSYQTLGTKTQNERNWEIGGGTGEERGRNAVEKRREEEGKKE